MKRTRKAGRLKPGERLSEMAFHRLDLLDRVISAVEKARDERVQRVKGSRTDESYSDALREPCSIQLHGDEASYLLRCLKAARARDNDPFSIAAAFRANKGLSLPEQAAIVREVQAELECGSVGSVAAAVERVSSRYPLGEAAVSELYYKLKDFV